MKKFSTPILLILFLMASCKEKKKTSEEPTQMQQVMAVHDEVMPKMGQLGKLVGELKSRVDTTGQGQRYNAAMKELQEADRGMIDWMMNFSDRFDTDEILNGKALTEQKQKWLNEEETKIKALKEQIDQSIEKAEALLNK